MLDHRRLLPPGTLMAKINDTQYILIYGVNGNTARFLPALSVNKKGTKVVGIADIAHELPGSMTHKEIYGPQMFPLREKHHKENTPKAVHKDFPQVDTVGIVAPGRFNGKELFDLKENNIPIVAVSSVINTHFQYVDYAVISDTIKFNATAPHNITSVFCTYSHPGSSDQNWKDTTWYTHMDDPLPGIPQYYASEGVITDALWFAIKQLKAKKVIMLGVEQPITDSNYFWESIFLQTHCFWYSQAGIQIWNCTPVSSVIAGVMIGKLDEAINHKGD